ncbi:MAG TPA: hypothetical protein VFW27_14855, partial [Actinoplanes sp.]|nr:hypothetical protein [Actinoplanes sp.]
MRQLQLFTSAQLATMRDPTKRRNYSAEAEEFRREHQRHRAWGLTQRHARKLRSLYGHLPSDEELRATWQEGVAAAPVAATPEQANDRPPAPPQSGPHAAVHTQPEPATVAHAEMEQAGPERAGLERAGLERAGLERAGLERAELEQAEVEPAEMERNEAGSAAPERTELDRPV